MSGNCNNVNYNGGTSDFLINFIPSLSSKKTAINKPEERKGPDWKQIIFKDVQYVLAISLNYIMMISSQLVNR